MSIITYSVAFVLVILANRVDKLSELLAAIGPKLQLARKEIGVSITRLFSREVPKSRPTFRAAEEHRLEQGTY